MTAALPPTSLRNVLTALMLAIFLGALDQTIVAVSLPAISAQFSDVGMLAWVISGYMVAMTVAVPIYGKLGDLYGRRLTVEFHHKLREEQRFASLEALKSAIDADIAAARAHWHAQPLTKSLK